MPNSLLPAAAEYTPISPATNYLAPSLNIMDRYASASSGLAEAEDLLKSSNEIDKAINFDPQNRRDILEKHNWDRVTKDREDEQYAQKKNFDSARGQFLTDLARIDEDDPEFDSKVAGMFADPAAAEDPAVKSILGLKVANRQNARAIEKQESAYNQRVIGEMATQFGIDPTEITSEKGTVDYHKVAAVGARATTAKAEREAAKSKREEVLKFYDGDRDVVDADSAEKLDPLITNRRKALESAAVAQGKKMSVEGAKLDTLIQSAPGLGKDAFAANALVLSGADAPPKEVANDPNALQLWVLQNGDKTSPTAKALVESAHSLWNAAHAKGRLAPPVVKGAPQGQTPTTEGGVAPPETAAQRLVRETKERVDAAKAAANKLKNP